MALDASLSWANPLLGVSWDSRLTLAAAAVVLPLLFTYALTYLRGTWATHVRGKGDPPPAPYAVPVVANTLQFAYDTDNFITRTLRRFGPIPFRLNVALENMYYIPHGEPIQAMFKNARDLAMKPIVIVAMRDQFGMPPRDLAIYERDGSGGNAKPLDGWEHLHPDHRVFYHQHRDLHAMLNGVPLDAMMARYRAGYTARLRESTVVPPLAPAGGGNGNGYGGEWTTHPDLFTFLRTDMFHSACTALAGSHFFAVNPSFNADFWAFDAHLLTYLRRTPRWLAPRAYAARDRVLASLARWHAFARKEVDYNDPKVRDVEYEPVWGSKLLRMRAEVFDKAGYSPEGCASMDLGFLWAANGNVIPATVWVVLQVLLVPGLRERVLAETEDCFVEEEGGGNFSVAALCGKPLLNGLYLESLRYCAATTSARNPVVDDFELLGWRMPRDSLIFSIGWFGARDSHFWNTGRVRPDGTAEHPVDTYWAERFLEYPDDPASGPVRKDDEAIYRWEPSEKKRKKTAEDDRTAKPVNHTAALGGYFYPYGGGSRICPGRHLAKQEMLITVAVMLREFEIELLDPAAARLAVPDPKVFPTGAAAPDRKLPIRVRRRRRE